MAVMTLQKVLILSPFNPRWGREICPSLFFIRTLDVQRLSQILTSDTPLPNFHNQSNFRCGSNFKGAANFYELQISSELSNFKSCQIFVAAAKPRARWRPCQIFWTATKKRSPLQDFICRPRPCRLWPYIDHSLRIHSRTGRNVRKRTRPKPSPLPKEI